jgi:hypothetical protein
MTPYDGMSREQLIDALIDHDTTLSEIYNVIHLPNKVMAPGEKLFWIAARNVLAREKPNDQGLVRLPTDAICEFNGMSDTSNLRYANSVIDRYSAKKETAPYITLKGQTRDLTYIDRSDSVWRSPWEIDLPEEKERQINGNGKYCSNCKTFNLKVSTIRNTYQELQECDCCGYTKVSPVLVDHEPLQPGEYIPAKKGPQAGEPFGEEQDQDQEKGSNICTPYYPSTPPLADVDSLSQEKAPQPEEPFGNLETEAETLLLDIAGDHSSHIEMCKRGPAKYVTVKASLSQEDIHDHLLGSKTKGVVSRSSDGMTRAVWFEGDTPDQWQKCKDAARLLAVMDFKPLLIPSPTKGKHQGGGHLWIIFSGRVDAYSSIQTVYKYTGSLLKGCKEYWPGGGSNVRLPGGKYIYETSAWCDLYNDHEEQLSHDGVGVAEALLQYQTPVEVVDEYRKPEVVKPAQPLGGYLDKDLAKQYIARFNTQSDWSDIANLAGGFTRGKFLAVWRGDRTPNVGVNPRTGRAKDFARPDEPAMDKYDVYCRIMALDTGEDWQIFKRRDLAERCEYMRSQLERKAS